MLQFDKGSLQLDHREHSPGEPYLIRNETYMVRRDVVTRDTAVTTNEKVLSVDFLSTRQRLVTISDSFTASDSESAYQGECAVAPALAGHSFLKMMENWIMKKFTLLLLI